MANNDDAEGFSDQTVELRIADLRAAQEDTAASSNSYFTLTVIEGNDFGSVFQLDKPENVIGRGDDVDIKINDSKTSRRHLLISLHRSLSGEGVTRVLALDLQSKNGTYLNGTKMTETELRSTDKLQIGDSILKFEEKDRLDISYHERLYQQATRDALTGLWNRNHAQEAMEKYLALASRTGRPFSLVLFDIDFFKSVNDTFGHDVGDAVLRETAQVISDQLRGQDIAARYGGEEFIVMMPETGVEGAVIAAERVRQKIESRDFQSAGFPKRLTVSIGIAQYPICGRNPEELFKSADEALYRAKETGRNRVCVASPFSE